MPPTEPETPASTASGPLASTKPEPTAYLKQILSVPAAIAVLFVRCYQVVLSPLRRLLPHRALPSMASRWL